MEDIFEVSALKDHLSSAKGTIQRLEAELAEAKKESNNLKEGWKQAVYDQRTHFEQSCTNLKRAEKAESELAECKAAICTPEIYVGVISESVSKEREFFAEENRKLRARCERLEGALKNLVDKLFKVHDDPEYYAVWSLYASHIPGGYKGITYTKELDEAKQALEVLCE